MLASVALYAGGVVSLAGAVMTARRRTRRTGLALLGSGLAVAVVALAWPAGEKRASGATELDAAMPRWQFDERHSVHVDATPERAFDAIRKVRADEIALFQTLTTIRRGGRAAPESIINAGRSKPLLDVATQSGFVYLADAAPRELVIGVCVVHPPGVRGTLTPDVFHRTLRPGFALAAMNFAVAPDPRGGSTVTTETRVFANDAATARKFAVYWRIVHPGSDIIRRMWLRAIRKRAEAAAGGE